MILQDFSLSVFVVFIVSLFTVLHQMSLGSPAVPFPPSLQRLWCHLVTRGKSTEKNKNMHHFLFLNSLFTELKLQSELFSDTDQRHISDSLKSILKMP